MVDPKVRQVVREMLEANAGFAAARGPDHFAPFSLSQQPRATVLACSDSRVQMRALSTNPENDVFVVRNIGNQVVTSEGSLEYAVRHLRTPVLLVLGHVRCGAIQAAARDFSAEPEAIRRELGTLRIPPGCEWLGGVRANVDRQVEAAMAKFAEELRSGVLVVLGAIYDFADDLGQGHGKLVFTNLQGENHPQTVRAVLARSLGAR